MKRKSYLLLAGVALMSAFTACSNEDEMKTVAQAEGTPLVVQSVGVDLVSTKAGIREAAFTNGEKIGVYIYTGAQGTLSGDYNTASSTIPTVNVPYTQNSPWSATQPIILSSTKGVVYGYYPYSESAGNGSAVPVNVAATQGTGQSDGKKDVDGQPDYMYATATADVSNKAATIASMTMNHALAMLTFKFVNSTGNDKYPGEGKVSNITIANLNTNKIVATGAGTMNIATGKAAPTAAASDQTITVSPSTTTALMGASSENLFPRMLVYPVDAIGANQAEIQVTVDGNNYKLNIPALPGGWVKGKNYVYTLTLKGTALVITNVAITPWGEEVGGAGDLQTPIS